MLSKKQLHRPVLPVPVRKPRCAAKIAGYDGYAVEVQHFSLKDPLNHAQKTCSHIFEGLTSESLIVSRCKGPPAKNCLTFFLGGVMVGHFVNRQILQLLISV